MRQQILRHLAAVAFECGGHTAELSMKRSCDNRGVAMASREESSLDETTANVLGEKTSDHRFQGQANGR